MLSESTRTLVSTILDPICCSIVIIHLGSASFLTEIKYHSTEAIHFHQFLQNYRRSFTSVGFIEAEMSLLVYETSSVTIFGEIFATLAIFY